MIEDFGQLSREFEKCRRLHKRAGGNDYFAIRLLPAEKRLALHALYAFFSLPKSYVNRSRSDAEAKAKLNRWQDDWRRAWAGGQIADPIVRANLAVFRRYSIPREHAEAFLTAMRQELTVNRYRDYAALEHYMYGAAAAPALMAAHILGFSEAKCLRQAESLGYAVQLTGILRDIGQDYRRHGRIYLPQDEMRRFRVSEVDIGTGRVTDGFRQLMRLQTDRARQLFREADEGLPYLDEKGQLAAEAIGTLNEKIIDKIEKRDFDVYSNPISVSGFEKMILAIALTLGLRSQKR